ncbi:MAG: chromosomal replication initiator protein DnaA [Chitinispirillia bacterium]|nr:chromosomal replication initiator protein DnaA [Chitinispirillia bacterium]MCL2240953.1 chromosomal replication initiator protein DnaA [Chitinispirillia bacterium]
MFTSALSSEYSAASPWEACQCYIREKIGPDSFETWFRRTGFELSDSGTARILVPDRFKADIMAANHTAIIGEALRECGIDYTHIKFVVDKVWKYPEEAPAADAGPRIAAAEEAIRPAAATVKPDKRTVLPPAMKSGLFHPDFTFGSFVVGESNRMACGAAQAVAQTPGITGYYPLVVYGGPGLGKTHLLHAIGNAAYEAGAARNVMYMMSEEFLREFHAFLSEKKSISFHEKFKDVDLLLIDDIQFFSKKSGIQEQFLQIFNHLLLKKKQIVLSCDRRPEELPDMKEHIINRLKGGLSVDIRPPDLATRMAILQKKAEAAGQTLTEESARRIAGHAKRSVRELEGMLNKLIAHNGIGIGAEEAVSKLCDEAAADSPERVSIKLIMRLTAGAFGVDAAQLSAKTRKKEAALPRSIAMYLCKKWTKQSTITIGEAFGGRTHSTVIHSANKIEDDLAGGGDTGLRTVITQIETQLHNIC